MNLIEGLQQEIKRVQEMIKDYEDPILNHAGYFASGIMRGSIIKAEKAIAEMDTIEMLKAYNELKEYEY
jgi:hypothetical protein